MKKASNTAGKRDETYYETVRLHGNWKDVFAPVLKGCPYDIQSKEGGGDSGNEDDSSDEEEENDALQCCDMRHGTTSDRCSNYLHRRCYIKAYNIGRGNYFDDDPLTIDNVHFCPDSSGDESTKLEGFDGGCGTFRVGLTVILTMIQYLQRQTPTRRGLSCGSDMVLSIQRG